MRFARIPAYTRGRTILDRLIQGRSVEFCIKRTEGSWRCDSMRPELIQAVELLRSPDPDAVDQALHLLQSTIFSFSMKVCGHREDAEDTMQEVLLKSLPILRKIENPQALAVWLYKVTRNRCWMSRRHSKFAPAHLMSLDELMPGSQELEALADASRKTPEAESIAQQQAERLQTAVLRIPAKYRLILVLHDMEDLSSAEIAKITGLQEGTIRVRLHRARLFVRRELAALGSKKSERASKRKARPVDCRRIFAGLSDYMDGIVDDLACERFQMHIQNCGPCVAFLEDLSRAVERCRSYQVGCLPETADAVRKLLVQEYLRFSHPNGSSNPTVGSRKSAGK